jgi:hypothetical protein
MSNLPPLVSLAILPVYFGAGFLTDFLVAKYYLCLSSHQRAKASALAVVIDFWGFIVTATLVLGENYAGALMFAIGTGAGTWVAMGKQR